MLAARYTTNQKGKEPEEKLETVTMVSYVDTQPPIFDVRPQKSTPITGPGINFPTIRSRCTGDQRDEALPAYKALMGPVSICKVGSPQIQY